MTLKMRRSKKKSACTINISCLEPNEDGKMQVEMTYDGDQVLVAFLLESAQAIFKQTDTPSKISSIGSN